MYDNILKFSVDLRAAGTTVLAENPYTTTSFTRKVDTLLI